MEEETVRETTEVGIEADQGDQSEEIPSKKTEKFDNLSKTNAIRMAGFFFWSNFVSCIALLIGCFAPGWATVADKEYSLWYVTVCDKFIPFDKSLISHDRLRQCETISYRLIRRWIIHTNLDYTDFVQAEILYCIGMILSFATLIKFYGYRDKVARGICVELSLKKWILLFILASISAVFALLPVGMFNGTGNTDISLFSGIVFAGFGGAVMTLVAASLLLHLLCRPVPASDICVCGPCSKPATKD